MENMEFGQRMALLSRKHSLQLNWQEVKFGYRRARFTCESHEELKAILNLLRKIGGIWTDFWCCFEGEFEGYVYAMDRNDWNGLEEKRKKERDRVEEWWMRYHLADEETRRLMACGKIE